MHFMVAFGCCLSQLDDIDLGPLHFISKNQTCICFLLKSTSLIGFDIWQAFSNCKNIENKISHFRDERVAL